MDSSASRSRKISLSQLETDVLYSVALSGILFHTQSLISLQEHLSVETLLNIPHFTLSTNFFHYFFFSENKSRIYQMSTKCNPDLQKFPLKWVLDMNYNSCLFPRHAEHF